MSAGRLELFKLLSKASEAHQSEFRDLQVKPRAGKNKQRQRSSYLLVNKSVFVLFGAKELIGQQLFRMLCVGLGMAESGR